jgi:hypothetical protein
MLKDSAQVSRSFVGALWLVVEDSDGLEVVGFVPAVLGSRANVVLLEVTVDSFDVDSLECVVGARGSTTGATWVVNVVDLLDVSVLEVKGGDS